MNVKSKSEDLAQFLRENKGRGVVEQTGRCWTSA
jgi:hypothetical protein